MKTLNKLDTLYKQTSTGKVQQWTVYSEGRTVVTVYGLVGGKLQTTKDVIKEGKNLGRSNATTPETQAALQAQQEYDGKLKEGYSTDMNTAATTKNTLGAIEPMLAFPLEKKEKYATFPALAQPKLDGLRCIAILSGGKARLYSRTQKEFTTVPHINAEIERLFRGKGDLILDGELYNHEFKANFNRIIELIKRSDVHPDHELVQYHVYDRPDADGGHAFRIGTVAGVLAQSKHALVAVETVTVKDNDALMAYQGLCVESGYEGCMYRNPSMPYEFKRSAGLLKVKTFQDAEFKIIGAEEGNGKLMGCIGAFIFELPGVAKTFKAKPACTLEQSKEFWLKRKSYLGSMATVKYQSLTPDGVPRFPVMKAIRNEE